jgi:hypothetical protein
MVEYFDQTFSTSITWLCFTDSNRGHLACRINPSLPVQENTGTENEVVILQGLIEPRGVTVDTIRGLVVYLLY